MRFLADSTAAFLIGVFFDEVAFSGVFFVAVLVDSFAVFLLGVFFVDAALVGDFGFGVEVVILVGVLERPRVAVAFFLVVFFAGADFTIGVDTRDGVRLRERRVTVEEKAKKSIIRTAL